MPITRSMRNPQPLADPPAPLPDSPLPLHTANRFSQLATHPDSDPRDIDSADLLTEETAAPLPPTPSPPPTPAAPSFRSTPHRSYPDNLVVLGSPIESSDCLALRLLGPVKRASAIHSLIGEVQELRVLRSGSLRIVARDVKQTEILLRTSSFAGIAIRFAPPRRHCEGSWGVITGISPEMDISDLSAALANQQICNFERLRRRTSDGQLMDTWSVKALFPGTLPHFVLITYERFPVRPFIRRPLRCFNCHRYGHGASNCKSPLRCGRCSLAHASEDCTSTDLCCPSCSGPHAAWASECPRRLREWRIEEHRASGLTFAEAVAAVRTSLPAHSTAPQAPLRPSPQPCPIAQPFTSSSTVDSSCGTDHVVTTEIGTMTDRMPSSPLVIPDGSTILRNAQEEDVVVFTMRDLTEFLCLAIDILRKRKSNGEFTSSEILAPLVLHAFFE